MGNLSWTLAKHSKNLLEQKWAPTASLVRDTLKKEAINVIEYSYSVNIEYIRTVLQTAVLAFMVNKNVS